MGPVLASDLCQVRVPPQGLSGEVEMRSNGPRRKSEVLRDLSMAPALEIVKKHDLSLDLRKPSERSSQPLLEFCMLRRLFRRPPRGRGRLRYGIRIPKHFAPHQVSSTVPYNRHKPTSESVGGPAIIESLKGHDEPLLCSVFGILMATCYRKADRIRRAHVAAHERPEGLAIPGLGPPDQNLVRCTFLFTHETPLPPAVLSTFDIHGTPETPHSLESLDEGADLAWTRRSGNRS